MTNKRTSFILHTDSLSVLDDLDDTEIANLFKAIRYYQINGELPELDKLTKIIINPFIAQFKRDESNYSKECKKSSEKGKLGNLKRWHEDIYKKVIDGKLDIDSAYSIAYDRPPITPDHPPIKPDKNTSPPDHPRSDRIPKSLKSESDNESDSDSKNDSVSNIININSKKSVCNEKKDTRTDLQILREEFNKLWLDYEPVKTKNGKSNGRGTGKKEALLEYCKLRQQYGCEVIYNGAGRYLYDCYKNDRLSCAILTFLQNETFLEFPEPEKKEVKNG